MSSNVLSKPYTSFDHLPPNYLLGRSYSDPQVDQGEAVSAAMRRIRYELDLPAGDRERAILDRLRSWLVMDREEARKVAAAFEDAAAQLSAEEQADHGALERDAILNGLSFYAFEQLAQLLPSLKDSRRPLGEYAAGIASPYALIAATLCGAAIA